MDTSSIFGNVAKRYRRYPFLACILPTFPPDDRATIPRSTSPSRGNCRPRKAAARCEIPTETRYHSRDTLVASKRCRSVTAILPLYQPSACLTASVYSPPRPPPARRLRPPTRFLRFQQRSRILSRAPQTLAGVRIPVTRFPHLPPPLALHAR
jgi:hypothetical protein